jgi:hypothetical protein
MDGGRVQFIRQSNCLIGLSSGGFVGIGWAIGVGHAFWDRLIVYFWLVTLRLVI